MRIGIEGQRLFRPNKHGMDVVALELIRNLQAIDRENEYVIFVKPDEDNTVLQETQNFRIVRLEGGFYPWWEQVALPRAAREEGCDVLHCTSNTAPVNAGIPLVVTLHDIIYMERSYWKLLSGSGTPYQRFGNAYRHAIVPRVLRNSSKIITVSGFEKQRISRFFGMNGDKRLTVVYNGVSDHFRPVTDPEELGRVKVKYYLPDKFFLFFGNTDPKKNTKGVIKAFAEYVRRNADNTCLVMTDYTREGLEHILDETGSRDIIDRIVLPGYVTNTDLPAMYSLCRIFLYPSVRESFGIPLLEAMACGAPVIAGNTSSMPEVAGDAACLVDPFKPEEIAKAMKELSNDPGKATKLVLKGFDRALKFSWRSMAESVRNIYEEIGKKS